jgi:hypothetical protein
MWAAIKSDLFEFVNTVAEDTTKTLQKVVGEEDEEVFEFLAPFKGLPIF